MKKIVLLCSLTLCIVNIAQEQEELILRPRITRTEARALAKAVDENDIQKDASMKRKRKPAYRDYYHYEISEPLHQPQKPLKLRRYGPKNMPPCETCGLRSRNPEEFEEHTRGIIHKKALVQHQKAELLRRHETSMQGVDIPISQSQSSMPAMGDVINGNNPEKSIEAQQDQGHYNQDNNILYDENGWRIYPESSDYDYYVR